VIAGSLVALLVVLLVRDATSESLPDAVRITQVPDAYRIVYEVRAAAGPERPHTISTEILQVDRPFRSLSTTRIGDRLVAGRVADLTRLYQHTDGRWIELQLPPALAASDIRLHGVLDDRVEAGDIERTDEVRRIAGRACQVHRLGGPVEGGSLTALDSVEGEVADVCVDEAGLVLLEEWTDDGELLRRRTAVDVDVDPDFDEDTFAVAEAEAVPATDGGGFAERVADDEPFGDRTLELPAVPDGFDRLGRWSIVWPRLQATVDPFASPTEGRVAGIATVWVRGADVIAVEQGAVSESGRPFEPHPDGERVDLGALDIGEVITDGRGTEVRVSYTDGSFVRVWSTLPRQDVLDLARSLEAR